MAKHGPGTANPHASAGSSRLEAPDISGIDIWDLPRGVHKLAHHDIVAAQRARLLYGIVHAVAEKGYNAARLADIVAIARLSKSTFYNLFKDKEDCFLAAYEAAHYELAEAVTGSQDPASDWTRRLRASLRAYLGYNRDNPAIARAFLVEIHAAGTRAWAMRDWGHARFARMQESLYAIRRNERPDLPELPDHIFLAVVAAIEEMACAYVRKDMTDRIMELEPAALFLLESVYCGHPRAVKALSKPA